MLSSASLTIRENGAGEDGSDQTSPDIGTTRQRSPFGSPHGFNYKTDQSISESIGQKHNIDTQRMLTSECDRAI